MASRIGLISWTSHRCPPRTLATRLTGCIGVSACPSGTGTGSRSRFTFRLRTGASRSHRPRNTPSRTSPSTAAFAAAISVNPSPTCNCTTMFPFIPCSRSAPPRVMRVVSVTSGKTARTRPTSNVRFAYWWVRRNVSSASR